jgi:hypothetical protein
MYYEGYYNMIWKTVNVDHEMFKTKHVERETTQN